MGKLFSILCGVMLLVLMVAIVGSVSTIGAQLVFAMFLTGLVAWEIRRRRASPPSV